LNAASLLTDLEPILPGLFAIVGAVIGGLAVLFINRRRYLELLVASTQKIQAESEIQQSLLDQQLDHALHQLSVEKSARNVFQQRLADQTSLNSELGQEKARLEERVTQLAQLQQQVREQQVELHELNARLSSEKSLVSELKTRLDEQRRHAEETRARMVVDFQNQANQLLDDMARKHGERNREGIEALLRPMREQLGEFRKRVDEIHHNDSVARASLAEQLARLHQLNAQMNEEARNLTRALKGEKKTQGNWGEVILERVLESSGLRRGLEYDSQATFRDEENRVFRPDVVIHLPEGKDVIVDSKVSLVAYEKFVRIDDERERQSALDEHVQSVRDHISDLGRKDYSNLEGVRSLDVVLMFMPIEPAFMVAVQRDETLFTEALGQKIVVVGPTTLLATLRIIENIWRYERQNENARKIAQKAGNVLDKLRGFVEDFERIGSQLDSARASYDAALAKLTTGRGNLIRQAETFVDLGVKLKKQLPAGVVEQAELDDEDLER
jgi:DNA recombination protein RmuC